MDDDDEELCGGPEHPCPRCGAPTVVDAACPGFGSKPVMVCSPPCGNALEWYCTNDSCGWWYREPNSRADRVRMGEPPEWPTS